MAADTFTEVTRQSWLGRMGGAIKGVLVGLVLFVAAFPLLFWNEGRAVQRYKTLKEGAGAVVSVAAEAVEAAREGALVHVTGKAETAAVLTDADFGISAKALKLKRIVEMYQWQESSHSKTQKKLGGGTETVTTYTYSKDWSANLRDSSAFKDPAGHQNPGAMPFESTVQTAGDVTLGAFTLSPSLVGRINNFEALNLGSDTALPEPLRGKAALRGSGFYIGTNAAAPQVGDVRVRFETANPAEVSVIARQAGKTFEPYRAKAGGTIELLQMGIHTAAAMIQSAQDSNVVLTWILRLVGFIVMLMGLRLMFKPLSVMADVLPIAGTIVGAGTGLIAFLLAAIGSLTTVAIAWIVYRPLLGILLLVVTVGLVAVARVKFKSAKAAP